VAALFAAIEFGIQPVFFRDAAGAPLYCPYPMSVSIPAMMIGHLTVAGIAELAVSAGVVAFLQRSNLSLLERTAGTPRQMSVKPLRLQPLWIGLGLLMTLTPLGILAAGAAWGEWMASDFASPAIRQQIAGASFEHAPPAHAPRGLQHLSEVWTAPFSRYAPPYVHSLEFGYFLSAMFGVGLVIVACLLMGRLIQSLALSNPIEPI